MIPTHAPSGSSPVWNPPLRSGACLVRRVCIRRFERSSSPRGEALFSPLRLRIRHGKFREPELLLVRDARDARSGERFRTGADAVVEVVSPDDPERDLVHKRRDYAEAALPEYWIVDPGTEAITVLELGEDGYVEHGVYGRGERAGSPSLSGFGMDVGRVFDAAGGE